MEGLKEAFAEAATQWEKIEKTPFDDYDVKLSQDLIGGALRDRMQELLELQGTITKEVAWYKYLEGNMKLLAKFVKRKAFKEVSADPRYQSEGPRRKGEIAETYKVKVPNMDKLVSFFDISLKELVYGYFADIGESVMNELTNNLEIGRSLLSWDKQEVSHRGGV